MALGVGALLKEVVPVAWEATGVPLALALPLPPPLPVAEPATASASASGSRWQRGSSAIMLVHAPLTLHRCTSTRAHGSENEQQAQDLSSCASPLSR